MALNALQAPLQTHGRTAVGNFTEYTLKTNQDQHAFVSECSENEQGSKTDIMTFLKQFRWYIWAFL